MCFQRSSFGTPIIFLFLNKFLEYILYLLFFYFFSNHAACVLRRNIHTVNVQKICRNVKLSFQLFAELQPELIPLYKGCSDNRDNWQRLHEERQAANRKEGSNCLVLNSQSVSPHGSNVAFLKFVLCDMYFRRRI